MINFLRSFLRLLGFTFTPEASTDAATAALEAEAKALKAAAQPNLSEVDYALAGYIVEKFGDSPTELGYTWLVKSIIHELRQQGLLADEAGMKYLVVRLLALYPPNS